MECHNYRPMQHRLDLDCYIAPQLCTAALQLFNTVLQHSSATLLRNGEQQSTRQRDISPLQHCLAIMYSNTAVQYFSATVKSSPLGLTNMIGTSTFQCLMIRCAQDIFPLEELDADKSTIPTWRSPALIGKQESDRLKGAVSKSKEVANMVRHSAVEKNRAALIKVTGLQEADNLERERLGTGQTMTKWIAARKVATTAWAALRKEESLEAWVRQEIKVVLAAAEVTAVSVDAASVEGQS